MKGEVNDVWGLRFSPEESRTVEEALREDGYPSTPEGLHDWVMDGIKFRGPDALLRYKQWAKANPVQAEAIRLTVSNVGKNIPGIFRLLFKKP